MRVAWVCAEGKTLKPSREREVAACIAITSPSTVIYHASGHGRRAPITHLQRPGWTGTRGTTTATLCTVATRGQALARLLGSA
jgi:hypothetical protein